MYSASVTRNVFRLRMALFRVITLRIVVVRSSRVRNYHYSTEQSAVLVYFVAKPEIAQVLHLTRTGKNNKRNTAVPFVSAANTGR